MWCGCARASTHPSTIHTYIKIYTDNICIIDVYVVHVWCVCTYICTYEVYTRANKKNTFTFTNRHLRVHTLISGGGKNFNKNKPFIYTHTYMRKRYVHILTFTLVKHKYANPKGKKVYTSKLWKSVYIYIACPFSFYKYTHTWVKQKCDNIFLKKKRNEKMSRTR